MFVMISRDKEQFTSTDLIRIHHVLLKKNLCVIVIVFILLIELNMKKHISERVLLIIIVCVLSLAGFLCLFALTTSGWNNQSVFSEHITIGVLLIISFVLLVICVFMVSFILLGFIVHEYFPFIFVSFLIVPSIFMHGAFTSFVSNTSNYSYSMMIAAFTFTYLTSIISTYWLFDVRKTDKMILISDRHSRPRLNVLT